MRIPQLFLALAGTLLCTGCSDLVALHPFLTDKDVVQDTRITGVWAEEGTLYIVRPDGNGYSIVQSEKSSSTVYKLKAKMFKVGEARILDLTPEDEDPFQVGVHTPLRVWMEGATLRMAFLDSKWIAEQAKAHLAVQAVGDRQLITSSGEEFKAFLVTYGADDRAAGKPTVLTHP